MEIPDHYRTLSLGTQATRREVEARFHRLMAARPAEDQRRAIESAYLVLSDPRRRSEYDRSRGHLLHPGLAAGPGDKARRLFEAGLRALAEGRLEAAHRSFRSAMACQPWEAEYRSYLGLAMARMGLDSHTARDLCREAVRLCPGHPLFRRHLAEVYSIAGLPKRARRVLSHCTD